MSERVIGLDKTGFKVMVVRGTHGRDKDKIYQITEWPASRAEEWGVKALLSYNRGGVELPGMEEMIGAGMEGVARIGIQSFLRGKMEAKEVQPILNELLDCVKIVRDPAKRTPQGDVIVADLIQDVDIMEVPTRMWLRSEVLFLHTGFSVGDALSALISAMMAEKASPSIQTSQG